MAQRQHPSLSLRNIDFRGNSESSQTCIPCYFPPTRRRKLATRLGGPRRRIPRALDHRWPGSPPAMTTANEIERSTGWRRASSCEGKPFRESQETTVPTPEPPRDGKKLGVRLCVFFQLLAILPLETSPPLPVPVSVPLSLSLFRSLSLSPFLSRSLSLRMLLTKKATHADKNKHTCTHTPTCTVTSG